MKLLKTLLVTIITIFFISCNTDEVTDPIKVSSIAISNDGRPFEYSLDNQVYTSQGDLVFISQGDLVFIYVPVNTKITIVEKEDDNIKVYSDLKLVYLENNTYNVK